MNSRANKKYLFLYKQTWNKQVIGKVYHQRQIGYFYKSDIPAFSGRIILVAEKNAIPKTAIPSPANDASNNVV